MSCAALNRFSSFSAFFPPTWLSICPALFSISQFFNLNDDIVLTISTTASNKEPLGFWPFIFILFFRFLLFYHHHHVPHATHCKTHTQNATVKKAHVPNVGRCQRRLGQKPKFAFFFVFFRKPFLIIQTYLLSLDQKNF